MGLEGFDEMIWKSWMDSHEVIVIGTNKSIVFKNKMKFVKHRIREWKYLYFANISKTKKELLCAVSEIEKILQDEGGSQQCKDQTREMLQPLQELDVIETRNSAQKAEIKWGYRSG